MILLHNNEQYTPEASDIKAWQQAYPAVDVEQEIKAMAAWSLSNPKKRKTERGIKRFINSWLARCQDRGRASPVCENSTRAKPIHADVLDISWALDTPGIREYMLERYGRYFDGQRMIES